MTLLVLFGGFVLLMVIGVPIAFALGISSVATLLVSEKMPLTNIVQGMFSSIDAYALLAVPLFIFAGLIMEYGGLSKHLTNVAKSFVGHHKGGLAGVTILACTFFAALSGSGPATVAAIGGIMIPTMVKDNYKADFSAGIVASGGTLGIIIPPSIPLVIYGVITSTSIGKLFIAGIIPGLIVAVALWLTSYIIIKKKYPDIVVHEKQPLKSRLKAINEAKLTLLMPVIILGGIYGGYFTPTEAAGVAVIYSFTLGVFVYKEIKLKDWKVIFEKVVMISGIALVIVTTASTYGRILILEDVPNQAITFLTGLTDQSWIIIIIILIFLVFIGMFMETLSMIILLSPILLPVVMHFGMDPVHFGILMILAAEIGFITPPVGDNLNIASAVSGETFENVSKATFPFTLALMVVLVIIAFLPQLVMLLPNLLSG